MGQNVEVVWAEFSTLSLAVLLDNTKMLSMQMAISKVENSAQVSSFLPEVCPWIFSISVAHPGRKAGLGGEGASWVVSQQQSWVQQELAWPLDSYTMLLIS
jgi:hypothetical protein